MSFKNWISNSFPVDNEALSHASSEPIPNHMKKWWFALGGTPFYMFLVQMITGVLLAFYYVPNPDVAYESVSKITNEISYGWLIRSIHKWSANIMIASVILHMMRVFFTQSFRKPRELNWMFGVIIFLLTLILGFTGYSLIYEQMSYWAMKVGTEIAAATPFVGNWIANFMRGGEDIGQATLSRMHILHVFVLPLVMVILLFIHVYLIRTLGVTDLRFKGEEKAERKTFPFWPNHVITELVMIALIMFVLVSLSIVWPAHMGIKADPTMTPMHIKPEWYFYPVYRWLKLSNLTLGVIIPMICVGILFFWPFIDRFFEKYFPKKEVGFWIGVLGAILLTVLLFWETIAH